MEEEPVVKVKTSDLLEHCWFFDNLLNIKTRMSRCYSDPSAAASSFGQEMLANNSNGGVSDSTKKYPVEDNDFDRPRLCIDKEKESNSRIRKFTCQSSLQVSVQSLTQPPCMEEKSVGEEHKSVTRSNTLTLQSSLLRAPSLPLNFGREEQVQDKERRKKTINRLESANFSDILPKGMTCCSSIPGYRPPRKSQTDLESEEVQGFKDLGFRFKKEDLSPSIVKILPGLQEKKERKEFDHDRVRRPYLSEAWLAQSCAPSIPTWAAKDSAEEMKEQIKCWARAVASNIR